jgi:hypothetical protein
MTEKKLAAFTSSTLRAVATQASREHQQRRNIFAAMAMALKSSKTETTPRGKASKASAR